MMFLRTTLITAVVFLSSYYVKSRNVSFILQRQVAYTSETDISPQQMGIIPASLRKRERELAARVRWEILWGETPEPYHSKSQIVRLTVYQTGDALWYCSRDLNACAQYKLQDKRLSYKVKSIKYEDGQDEIDSVLKFAGELARKPSFSTDTPLGVDLSSSGTLWVPLLKIGSRKEIVTEYKKMHPARLIELRNELQKIPQNAGYSSITIARFDPLYERTFTYGSRPKEHGGPIICQYFWDEELEEWRFAAMLELYKTRDRKRFEDIKNIIQSIAFSTIKF
jgi:hypothetical protein